MPKNSETPKKEMVFLQATAREIQSTYGPFFAISINKADFNNLPTDSSWYVKITMNAFKNGRNEYWNTHYLTLNNYVKKQEDQEILEEKF